MADDIPGKRLVLLGEFNVELARKIAATARPRRAPAPGTSWILREWTEIQGGEVVAFAQWIEVPDEPPAG